MLTLVHSSKSVLFSPHPSPPRRFSLTRPFPSPPPPPPLPGLTFRSNKREAKPAPLPVAVVPDSMGDIYAFARKRLQSSTLIGREAELEQLRSSVSSMLSAHRGGTVYCYGPSGVGKSMTIATLLSSMSGRRSATFNLATGEVTDLLKEVFCRASSQTLQSSDLANWTPQKMGRKIRALVSATPFILVLEEADQKQYLADVRELWACASDPSLQLVLIATGNQRNFLAALQREASKELHFAPYTRDMLTSILQQRLGPAVVDRLFDGIALRQLAEKAANDGDLRTALGYVQEAIKAAEDDYLSRLDDGSDSPHVGKINARVMRRVFETSGFDSCVCCFVVVFLRRFLFG
jgi:Cdc6-like AAA superfamily ATPase